MDMDKYFRQLVGCKIVSFYFQEDERSEEHTSELQSR